MSRVAYVNGRYLAHGAASVAIDDRGYQFGDGVYEVIYVHHHRLIDAVRHLDRLDRSLREMRLAPPLGRAALTRVIDEILRRNRIVTGLVYMQITRGVERRDHAFPSARVPASLVVTAKRLPPFPATIEQWTGSAITLPDQRWARCDIKSLNLLPNVLARQAAREAGATEAILIGPDGHVTEGAATSVWVVDQAGTLRLRDLDARILPGCTREALCALLAGAGIAVRIGPCPEADLRAAREIFLTSATSFVKPILSLDGRPVGDGQVGPVARQVFALYARHLAAA